MGTGGKLSGNGSVGTEYAIDPHAVKFVADGYLRVRMRPTSDFHTKMADSSSKPEAKMQLAVT